MEQAIRELMSGLTGIGYAVDVYHRHNSAPPWVSRPSNKWQSYLADVLLSWYLGRRLGKEGSDNLVAVISNGPFGWYLPTLRPLVKRIHFYHGTYRGQVNALGQSVSRFGALKLKWWDSMVLERLSGRRKQIVCNSDQTLEEVLKFFAYAGQTVWLPLDTSHFAPRDKSASRKDLGFAETDKIGLFVGNALLTKGFPVVRRLVDTLRDVKWVLALRGEVPNDVRQDSRVLIFKNASYDVLPSLYNAADFAICPSRYEAFGYVVAEALACGTPVVASPGGASRLFLSTPPFENFLVNRADSMDSYIDAITTILAHPGFYRQSVIDLVRPEVEKVMAPGNWLRRFCESTGL
jgi:glycosyltransferase involved in cell wall biosynthesis